MNLPALVRAVRAHPGLRAKRDLAAVGAAVGGDGDDAALVPDGEGHLALAGEAIHPPFVAAQPRAAGVAGVVTVLNDLAATGARPLALLDCLVAGSRRAAGEILAGLRVGADLYGVPVLGGHTTVEERAAPALSTFALGRVRAPLAARNARPGDAVTLLVCLEGEMMVGAGSSFFSHLRGPRRERAAADLALLADAAEAGDAWAARDVSMPGVAGSLLQLCESAGGLGCALDVEALPLPAGLPLDRWLLTFPSFCFLLVGDPQALRERFAATGLVLARVGTLDSGGVVRLRAGGDEEPVWDLGQEPLTGLGPRRPDAPRG
jgi:selenophosphate synthetase-related protein